MALAQILLATSLQSDEDKVLPPQLAGEDVAEHDQPHPIAVKFTAEQVQIA